VVNYVLFKGIQKHRLSPFGAVAFIPVAGANFPPRRAQALRPGLFQKCRQVNSSCAETASNI
jgi:hypothetical protein